jgi:hypothetical protein
MYLEGMVLQMEETKEKRREFGKPSLIPETTP